MPLTSIAIVGDFDPHSPSHNATTEAVEHAAKRLEIEVESRWVPTESLGTLEGLSELNLFDGYWIAPGSPYKSMDGVLDAIRNARENHVPLLGTCGGFQHIIIEFARNVLGIADAEHAESSPHASRLFISRLSCSLVGRTLNLTLQPGSMLARVYGQTTAQEGYYCNFGVNPEYVPLLRSSALKIVASDTEGEVRAVELTDHPFFLGTLFIPQHKSTAANPHPVIAGFVKACSLQS
jgi:CTP synthase (UTP-ammonia lyase)